MGGPERLEFRILGPLDVRRNGERVALGGLKQRALLAVLLLHANESVSTDRLVEELWSDAPPATAAHTIQVFISRLRKAVGAETLARRATGYAAEIDTADLDLARFDALVEEARALRREGQIETAADRLRDALRLWRGPALADFAYEPFAGAHTERLEEERLSALEERIELDLELGRHASLNAELEELTTAHPLRERARGLLMLALYRSGRQAEALAEYQRLRSVLVEQLGLEPQPELQELHRRLLNHDTTLDLTRDVEVESPIVSHLPLAPTPFYGRTRELAEVTSLLDEGALRLLTLTGPGGSGKTRLAHQAALGLEQVRHFADGVWWVALQAIRDPKLVLPTVARALDSKDGVAEHIADSHVLIVLDNFEQVSAAATELADLLASCANLKLLVTSRERLQLSWEQVYPVPPLVEGEAVELFVARARAVGKEVAAHGVVRDICRKVDNLPLALELAAARSDAFDPPQLLERLERALGFLTHGARDAPERHRTVRATIEWSYDLLSVEEQPLFARLSVFAGGFTMGAAERVCDAGADVVQSLLDKSLLRGASDTDTRLRMLETIREFARERLEEDARSAAKTRRRHCSHFAAWLAELRPRLDVFRADAIEAVEAELANIRAALAYAAELEPLVLARLVGDLDRYWATRGAYVEAEEWARQGLTTCPPDADGERADCLLALGTARLCLGDQEGAAVALDQSVALLRHDSRPRQLTRALNQLGAAAFERRDLPAARAAWEESLLVAENAAHREDALRAKNNVATVVLELGDKAAALRLFEEVATAAAAIGDERNVALATANVGVCAFELDDMDTAEQQLRASLPMLKRLEWNEPIVYTLNFLAMIAQRSGDPTRAVRPAAAAETLAASLDLKRQDVKTRDELLAALQVDLGPDFERLWHESRAADPWQVVAEEMPANP